jgi:hypothetical protein
MTYDNDTEAGTMQEHINSERERLSAERESIFTQQGELARKLDEINREFAAIEAYEQAKLGKAPKAAPAGTRRARKGSRREELLNLIREGGGLSRGDILDRMGLKGDKSGEMSVSNALTALFKAEAIVREGGKYFATTAAQPLAVAAE